MTNFCVLVSLFFLITCLFSDFGFILSLLFDRSFSISLDFSTVKLTLDVLFTDYLSLYCLLFLCYVEVSVLLVSHFLLLFLGFRNRFLSCGLTTGVCLTSLFFESWFINEFMILPLFLSYSLRNDICCSRWFMNLSDISFVEFS